MRKRLVIYGGLAITGAAALVLSSLDWEPAPDGIRSISPRSVPAYDLGTVPIYLQTDSRWANQTIGGSGESMGSVGCTVCCISMALVHHGVESDPATLNGWLKSHGGYTERGWVKWAAAEEYTGNIVRIRIPGRPSHRAIDRALESGNPVIAKIALPSQIHHWLLIVGREGVEYLVKDPLGDGDRLIFLSSYASNILAIRIVEKRA